MSRNANRNRLAFSVLVLAVVTGAAGVAVPGAARAQKKRASTPLSSRASGGRAYRRGRTARRVVPAVHATATVEKVDARTGDGDTPLGATLASCLTLAPNGKTILIGLPDGGVAVANNDKREIEKTVRLPQNAPPTRQVVATGDGKTVWWLSGATGDAVYSWRVGDDKLTAYHVGGADAAGWVRRLGVLHGRVVLIGDGVSRLLDAKTGALEPIGDALPGGAATFADGGPSPLLLADNGGKAGALLVAEGPDGGVSAASLWRGDKRDTWTPAGATSLRATNASGTGDALAASCAVTGDGLAVAQNDGVRVFLPADNRNDAPLADTLAPFGNEPGRPSQADTVALAESGVWWTAKGVLFRADARDAAQGATDAFLPWNGLRRLRPHPPGRKIRRYPERRHRSQGRRGGRSMAGDQVRVWRHEQKRRGLFRLCRLGPSGGQGRHPAFVVRNGENVSGPARPRRIALRRRSRVPWSCRPVHRQRTHRRNRHQTWRQ